MVCFSEGHHCNTRIHVGHNARFIYVWEKYDARTGYNIQSNHYIKVLNINKKIKKERDVAPW